MRLRYGFVSVDLCNCQKRNTLPAAASTAINKNSMLNVVLYPFSFKRITRPACAVDLFPYLSYATDRHNCIACLYFWNPRDYIAGVPKYNTLPAHVPWNNAFKSDKIADIGVVFLEGIMKKKLYSILLVALSCVSIAGIGLATSTNQNGKAAPYETVYINLDHMDQDQIDALMYGQSDFTKNKSLHKVTYDEVYSIVSMKPTVYRAVATTYAYPTPFPNGARVTGVPAGTDVLVTGICPFTGWYRIDVNGTEAYVSNNRFIDLPNMTAQNVSAMAARPFYDKGVSFTETDAGVIFNELNIAVPIMTKHDLADIKLQLINAVRTQRGLKPVVLDSALASIADSRAAEINSSYKLKLVSGSNAENIGRYSLGDPFIDLHATYVDAPQTLFSARYTKVGLSTFKQGDSACFTLEWK